MAANDNVSDERLAEIEEKLGKRVGAVVRDRGQVTLEVSGEDAHSVLKMLRDEFAFDFPVDLTAIDYSEWPGEDEHAERYAIVYALLSTAKNDRIRVKAPVSEIEPEIPTTSDLYGCFDWAEREVYDMFGIRFTDHPNLIRILCPENMRGYPLRKDYPLTGLGEREDFPVYDAEGK